MKRVDDDPIWSLLNQLLTMHSDSAMGRWPYARTGTALRTQRLVTSNHKSPSMTQNRLMARGTMRWGGVQLSTLICNHRPLYRTEDGTGSTQSQGSLHDWPRVWLRQQMKVKETLTYKAINSSLFASMVDAGWMRPVDLLGKFCVMTLNYSPGLLISRITFIPRRMAPTSADAQMDMHNTCAQWICMNGQMTN